MSKTTADPSMKIQEPKPPNNVGMIVGSILGVTFVGAGAIVAVILLRPKEDNAALIASILGFLVPTTAGLLAVLKSIQTGSAVQELHMAVNSRLTQLLEITAKASKAEGEASAVTAAAAQAAEVAATNAKTAAETAAMTAAEVAAALSVTAPKRAPKKE